MLLFMGVLFLPVLRKSHAVCSGNKRVQPDMCMAKVVDYKKLKVIFVFRLCAQILRGIDCNQH